MRTVLLLDTETTGLDPAQGAICIEVAVQLFDIELASAVASFSTLMWPQNMVAANPAENVNGISPKLLERAPSPEEAWRRVQVFADRADCVVAHRIEFDSKFTPPLYNVFGKTTFTPLPWVCTKTDIKWPNSKRGDHLVHLALDLGLGMAAAHRAMTDVDTMSRILTRVAQLGHSLPELFKLAMRPKVKVISLAPFEDKEMVKDHGFLWDPAPKKQWYRWMPPEDRAELPFPTKIDASSTR